MKFYHIALLFFSVIMMTSCSSNQKSDNMEKNVLENIATRVSVRTYLDKSVDDATIEKLLRAGMAAPSAMNKQPWHFVVVTDKQQLLALSEANPYAGMLAEAPLAIVVCGDLDRAIEGIGSEYWVQDCSAATQNILLAANAMGLGAVWTGSYPIKERCDAIAKALHLSENVLPLNIIVIGYPAGENIPKDKWDPNKVSYNTYNNGDVKQNVEKHETVLSDFDYESEFKGSPFSWFKGSGALLCVGDKESHNAMTIGWGSMGNVWYHDVNTMTVYVAPSRYTKEFMEKYKYFTVMSFDEKDKDILAYMGSHSGRDGDKAEALGLHVAYTENGAPYYEEAKEVFECEIIYRDQFDATGFEELPRKRYEDFPAGIHHVYIGKILSAKRR